MEDYLRKANELFGSDVPVKWYELRRVSQERAAKIAGLSRAEFIDALGQFGVSPFQCSADEAMVRAVLNSIGEAWEQE